jgi:hypothetical protein
MQLENNLRALSGLLKTILTAALDPDVFAVASSPITDATLWKTMINVHQSSDDHLPRSNQLLSFTGDRTVAVVDRTSDVALAARELVAARFSFGGTSPYAPNVIFVNEFVKQDFLQAVLQETVKLSGGSAVGAGTKGKPVGGSRVQELVDGLRQSDRELRVVLQESKYAVVEVQSRQHEVLAKKLNGPVLVLHAIRSLDDAIDLINNTGDNVPSLAAYHFSNAASAKYLTQFVNATASFVNNVPREILVGPAFPASHPIDLAARYPLDLFKAPKPAFIIPPLSSVALDAALSSQSNAAAQMLLTQATVPLAAFKRNPGGGVGFFEQGFLMNAGLILTTTVSITGFGVYYLVRHGIPRRLW